MKIMVAACETGVEECKGRPFNVMPFVYLETEHPEGPPLFFRHSALHI